MPIPFILGAAAAIAGIAGVAAGVKGAVDMKEAKDTMELAKHIHERASEKLKQQNETTCRDMDAIGNRELEILQLFKKFSDIIEKIDNRPEFRTKLGDCDIPQNSIADLREVSVGAAALASALVGAGLGTAGGLAASGATTAAVWALGTAGTGSLISSLSGAAATNATLAFFFFFTLAAGGGGMALGATVLSAATLGAGLLVGGLIFSVTGSKLSDKADDAWREAHRQEETVDQICSKLEEISDYGKRFLSSLNSVYDIYAKHLDELDHIVNVAGKRDWTFFSANDQLITENTIILVNVLHKMCKTELVRKDPKDEELKIANTDAIMTAIGDGNIACEHCDIALHEVSIRS